MAVNFQDHFHLDLPANTDTDGAPTAYYKSRQRAPQPVVQTVAQTSWTGIRHRSTLVDESDTPILHEDVKFRVVGTSEQYKTMCNLLGRTVLFIDNIHPDTGEDHSDYIKTMVLISITDVAGIGQKWFRMEFTIELQELG